MNTITINNQLCIIDKPLIEDFEYDDSYSIRAMYPINENNDLDVVVMSICDPRFSPYQVGEAIEVECKKCSGTGKQSKKIKDIRLEKAKDITGVGLGMTLHQADLLNDHDSYLLIGELE